MPALIARIWPARFVDLDSQGEGGEQGEYQGCYLVGLEWGDAGGQDRSREDIKATQGALQGVLQRFVEQIQGDEKYYNPGSCWISASVVNGVDLSPLALDSREWGEYSVVDDSDSELDDAEDEEEVEDPMHASDEEVMASVPVALSGRQPFEALSSKSGTGIKLRSAVDVMNRLRWDPSLDSSDYIIGYDDRFLGAKEKPLDLWKSEQTDEEFIPQHRILYFKRKADGEIIWDRRARKDVVFGSGG